MFHSNAKLKAEGTEKRTPHASHVNPAFEPLPKDKHQNEQPSTRQYQDPRAVAVTSASDSSKSSAVSSSNRSARSFSEREALGNGECNARSRAGGENRKTGPTSTTLVRTPFP